MYFEYVPVDNTKEPSPEERQKQRLLQQRSASITVQKVLTPAYRRVCCDRLDLDDSSTDQPSTGLAGPCCAAAGTQPCLAQHLSFFQHGYSSITRPAYAAHPKHRQRDTVHIPVPEDEVLQEETVFASSSAQAASIAAGHAARQQQQQQRRGGLLALLTCSCLREPSVPEISSDSRSASAVPGGAAAPGGSIGYGASGAASSLGRTASGAAGGASRRQMSRRTSSARKWVSLRRMGSSAYSDAEWFDAASSWGHDDHHAMLAEVESMVKELAPPTGPWVPDPPLSFAVPNMQFIPVPAKLGLAGWWEKDDDRTTPPPLPIDVMLKASWMVQKSHNSVPGVFFEETEKELNMMVKPRFVPPGFPRYQEYYDKTQKEEKTWALRRDLKTGRSYGRIFFAADGTIIFRVWTRPMFGNDVDVILEEYMRFEEEGKVLVARQCCLDSKSGKRAVQYLVGRWWEHAPKGSI
ncbi:hypothetical protein OEZ85_014311 [Tetradesmus obliquus]|uniref:Uncharacterized protein n=1 Tax=Tetradesmus obliquus TaxID=3088 RepID=A0ABY8U7N8_TETOB|nr:hypothetical protein OEZ85_014311 [Tetradesmus obliquus]